MDPVQERQLNHRRWSSRRGGDGELAAGRLRLHHRHQR